MQMVAVNIVAVLLTANTDFDCLLEEKRILFLSSKKLLQNKDKGEIYLTNLKRIISIALIFIIIVAFSGCEININLPGSNSSVETPSSSTASSNSGGEVSNSNSEPSKPADRLSEIRATATAEGKICSISFLGYFYEYSDELSSYLVSSGISAEFPFTLEIPDDNFVKIRNNNYPEYALNLFLVVPTDLMASVAVNDLEQGDVSYRSEYGDPILVACNQDDANPNALLTIVDSNGVVYEDIIQTSMMDSSLDMDPSYVFELMGYGWFFNTGVADPDSLYGGWYATNVRDYAGEHTWYVGVNFYKDGKAELLVGEDAITTYTGTWKIIERKDVYEFEAPVGSIAFDLQLDENCVEGVYVNIQGVYLVTTFESEYGIYDGPCLDFYYMSGDPLVFGYDGSFLLQWGGAVE